MSVENTFSGCTLFNSSEINALRESASVDADGDYYVTCRVRQKRIKLNPEEVVRQLYIMYLQNNGIRRADMELEQNIQIGSTTCRADISVFGSNRVRPDIIAEVKTPGTPLKKQIDQLKGYLVVTGTTFGVFINGNVIKYFARFGENDYRETTTVPEGFPDLLKRQSSSLNYLWTGSSVPATPKEIRREQRYKSECPSFWGTIFKSYWPLMLLPVIGVLGVNFASYGWDAWAVGCQFVWKAVAWGTVFVYAPIVIAIATIRWYICWRQTVANRMGFRIVRGAIIVALLVSFLWFAHHPLDRIRINPFSPPELAHEQQNTTPTDSPGMPDIPGSPVMPGSAVIPGSPVRPVNGHGKFANQKSNVSKDAANYAAPDNRLVETAARRPSSTVNAPVGNQVDNNPYPTFTKPQQTGSVSSNTGSLVNNTANNTANNTVNNTANNNTANRGTVNNTVNNSDANRIADLYSEHGHSSTHSRRGNQSAQYAEQSRRNQPGYNQSGNNQSGYNQPGYNQPGYNQSGYNQLGYNQQNNNQSGYNQKSNQSGYVANQPEPAPNARTSNWSEQYNQYNSSNNGYYQYRRNMNYSSQWPSQEQGNRPQYSNDYDGNNSYSYPDRDSRTARPAYDSEYRR